MLSFTSGEAFTVEDNCSRGNCILKTAGKLELNTIVVGVLISKAIGRNRRIPFNLLHSRVVNGGGERAAGTAAAGGGGTAAA